MNSHFQFFLNVKSRSFIRRRNFSNLKIKSIKIPKPRVFFSRSNRAFRSQTRVFIKQLLNQSFSSTSLVKNNRISYFILKYTFIYHHGIIILDTKRKSSTQKLENHHSYTPIVRCKAISFT